MAKRATKPATTGKQDELQYLYKITTDYLVNPNSDTPLSGYYTREEIEELGLDVDGLVSRGILEKTDRVRQ